MLHPIKIALIAFLLACSGTALAALDIVEEAAEANVSGTTLPRHEADQVVVRDCTGCEPSVWRVNASTQYFVGVNSRPIKLVDLLAAAAGEQQGMLTIFFKPGTDEVTRIVLSLSH